MKKQLNILLLLVVLVFAIFSSSTNSFAVENDINYEDNQIIPVSETLDDSYLTRNDIGYESGQIISVSEDNTIDVFYPNFTDIRETYYYEEYSEGHLKLIKVVKSANGWFATFSETMPQWVE